MIQSHLGLFNNPYYQFIIDHKKQKELRISKNQCRPYRKITKNDIVYMQLVGNPIIEYKFIVRNVQCYHFLNIPEDTEAFLIKNQYDLWISYDFIRDKINAEYATLIDIGEVIKLSHPFSFQKSDRRAWITNFRTNSLF